VIDHFEDVLKLVRENDFGALCDELDGMPDIDPWVAHEKELLAA
jgi:hypothetical protein